MKKNNFWFTLIEILVWVSISVILMLSVGAFVTSWMKNITLQKMILNNKDEYIWIFGDFNEIFSDNFEIIDFTQTWWIKVKSLYNSWKPMIYELILKTQTWECENDDTIKTNYLELKNYNPFVLNSSIYSWSYIKHEIYSWTTKIVWNQIFWDNLSDWMNANTAYLNNPAWIANWEWKIFISDSGNNRILYLSWTKLYNLVDYKYDIYNPTWILYDSWLYILNSWKKELLYLSSNPWTNKPIDISFDAENSFTFDQISLKVLDNFTINWSYNTWSFNFVWMTKNIWDTTWVFSNSLIYNFTWSQNITFPNTYKIEIPSFSGTFWELWNYYIKLSFLNWWSLVKEKYFPYQINGDNYITTLFDDDFLILSWVLVGNYTDLSLSGTDLLLKDYISWEYLKLSNTWSFIWTWVLSNIPDFESITKTYGIKIKDLNIEKNWNLLNIKIEYYKNFSCIDETQNIIKTILFKKTLSN